MDEMKLLEAIGAIDDVVLKKALSYRPSTCSADVANFSSTKEKKNTTRKKSKRNIWIKWVSIAACFCLLFVSSFVLIANFVTNPSTEGFVIEDKVLISYTGNDKNVVIPDNVVTIADYAFKEGGSEGECKKRQQAGCLAPLLCITSCIAHIEDVYADQGDQ